MVEIVTIRPPLTKDEMPKRDSLFRLQTQKWSVPILYEVTQRPARGSFSKHKIRNSKSEKLAQVAKTQREGRILSAFATLRETFRVSNFNFEFPNRLPEAAFVQNVN